jgi:Zn-dependent M32 family carboxypeptidase
MENELIINDIIRRIGNLEKTTVLSILSIIISLIAGAVSILSYLKNNSVTKDNALTNVKLNIDTSKSHYENLCMETANLHAKKSRTADEERELELRKTICDSAFEKVLNAYEDGCDRFFKNKVNKRDFKEKYHPDIVKYVEEFPEMFSEPLTAYNEILDYYKKNHKMRNI